MAISGTLFMVRNAVGNCRSLLLNRYLAASYQQNASIKQSVEEKLGLPLKPKRPLSPYFRYMAKIRPTIVKSHPGAKITEIVQLIAQQWAKVGPIERQQLESEYKHDFEAYSTIRGKYDQSLTEAQKEEIKHMKLQEKESKEKLILKKKKRDLGKPKKPVSGFLAYLQAKAPSRGAEPFKDWQKKIAKEWDALPAAEKTRLLTASKNATETYKRELLEWEEKMIRLGHIDMVRNEALIQPKSVTRSARVARAGKE